MISGLALWLQLTASDSKERKPGVGGGGGGRLAESELREK